MDELEAAIDLGPENEQQLAQLRRALILGSGFQLVFLEVSQPDLGNEVLRRLLQWSNHDGVPALTVVRTRPGRDPVAALRGVATGAVLVGIDEDPIEQSMTTLNWYRDELPQLVPGPLVVMLSPDGLRQLFAHAPDLLAWRAHTTRVTSPRPTDLEVRPWPSRRASLEEKAWLERMIAAAESNTGGPLARSLPGWLIRLGEIQAREGGPWEQSFARAEELAAGRRDILFRLELARARRALDEERYADAEPHENRAAEQVPGSLDASQEWESAPGMPGRSAARRELGWISHDVLFAELRVVRAERLLRIGESDKATEVAEAALRSARASGDLALVIAALGVAAAVASHRGDHAEATRLFNELREVARIARDPAAEVFALIRLVELAPDVEHAQPLYRQAMAMTQDDDQETRARACIAIARHEIMAGDPDEAERILSEVTSLTELQPRTRMRLLITRGGVATARDRHDDALTAYRMAWDEQERAAPLSRQHARIGVLLGEAALRASDSESARGAYRRVAEIADVLADSQLAATAHAGLDRARLGTDEPDKVEGSPGSAIGDALAWTSTAFLATTATPTAKVSDAEITAMAVDPELASLESKFIALDAPGDAPERLDLLDRLARAYMRLGQRRDAGLCHARAVWESPATAVHSRLETWLASELGTTDDGTIDEALDRILADEAPPPHDVRLVAALAAHASEPVARDPQRVQRWLDRFDNELDTRTMWLARLGLAHLPGGNPRHLAHTRDRILARLAGGMPAEREQPTFLRLGGHSGVLGALNGQLLAEALEDLTEKVAKTKRRRTLSEAPVELTNAYAAFQLGHGFARIGRHERARQLATQATTGLTEVASDPVHRYLIGAFTARIEQAIAGLPLETPLPDTLRAGLARLDRVSRYKVDRFREASRILEPITRPDPIGAFCDRQLDSRGPEFSTLGAIVDSVRRAREIDKLAGVASTNAGERARLIGGILDELFELPESLAVPIFARTWPLIAEVAMKRRAMLYAEALVVAGHFGRMELVPQLLELLGDTIRGVTETDLERVLEQSLRALRRIGLRKEILELLAEVERAVPATRLRTRIVLAAGMALLGDFTRTAPTFEQAHRALRGETHWWPEPVGLARALATAYSQTPLPIALDGIAKLAGQLRYITDSLGTNSHYCLSVLHFVESLVLGITSDDLVLGETGRRFVEDDEHLIRRRLLRDLTHS